jgi:hypothetical protein
MPLWRGPLDELIDDLERVAPMASGPVSDVIPPFDDVQLLVSAILWGTEEECARVERDPRMQAVLAYYERFAAHQKASDEPTGREPGPAVTVSKACG